jgi:hypothetical protein
VAFAFLLYGINILRIFAAFNTAERSHLHFLVVLNELDHIIKDSFELFIFGFHDEYFLFYERFMLL